jgi:streptogramin lyase
VANQAARRTTADRVRRTVAAAAAVFGLVAVVACTPPSTLPDGSVPQSPPFGTNGMTVEGDQVWVADLLAGQVLRFDPATGVVTERYGATDTVCHTDDLVVVPGGDLVATCPGEGLVVRIDTGDTGGTGEARGSVLADVGTGVNPIALDPSGDAVLVGFGTEVDDRLLRVPLDGGPVTVVADGLPVLNGFAVGPDGALYVPTGGGGGIFGTGGLGRIDLDTGAFEQLDLHFPDPATTGFNFACGVDVAADGTVFVAQCFDAAAFAVDPSTGAVTLVGRGVSGIADNVAVLADGRVLLSGFFGPTLSVFTPQGGGYSRSSVSVGG